MKSLSTANTNLNACFQNRSLRSNHKVSLTLEEQKNFLYYIHKLTHTSGYGTDILEQAAFLELMVFLNKRFQKNHIADTETQINSNAQVDSILSYINQHIEEPLSLEQLSSHFFISSSYLCGFLNLLRVRPLINTSLQNGFPMPKNCWQKDIQ